MAGTKPLSLNQAVSSSLFAPALPSVMWPSLRAASKAYDLTEESNDPAEPMAANTVNTSNSEVPNIFGLGSDGSGTSEAPGTPAEADKDIKQEKIAPSSAVKKEDAPSRKRIKLEKQSPPRTSTSKPTRETSRKRMLTRTPTCACFGSITTSTASAPAQINYHAALEWQGHLQAPDRRSLRSLHDPSPRGSAR